jgi:hypothetical protein
MLLFDLFAEAEMAIRSAILEFVNDIQGRKILLSQGLD